MRPSAPTPVEAWLCRECDTAHESEEEAQDCCRPGISEGYLCPVCRVFHEDHDDAEACCYALVEHGEIGEVDPLRVTMATRTEREMAGQHALF